MNARDATALTLKLAAIVLLLRAVSWAIQMLPMMLWPAANSDDALNLWQYGAFILPSAIQVAILLVTIRAADAIAHRLVPREEAGITVAVDAATVQIVAFTILGVALVATGFPGLVKSACFYLAPPNKLLSMDGEWEYRRHLIGIVPHVVQIIVGLFLFLRADGLHNLWTKLRKADGVQDS